MDRKQEILRKLRHADGYLSGRQLSEDLGVSRTAVWKNISKLKEEGYPIEAVTNKGYRLLSMEERDLLNGEEVLVRLKGKTNWIGHPFLFKEETGSTNNDLFELSSQGSAQGTVMASAKQTAGKGRRGRVWLSPPDVNAYMSVLLKPKMQADKAPMVTLVMALSVARAMDQIRENMGIPEEVCRYGIKWPNDIVASRNGDPYKKVCGILTEMRMEEMEIRDIVIGVGMNVNQETFPEEIEETASSMRVQMEQVVCRADLIAEVLQNFERDYEIFAAASDLTPLQKEYESYLVNSGRKVRILDPVSPYTGTAKGITGTGELIVVPEGSDRTEYVGNGEVSVRGVEGYV